MMSLEDCLGAADECKAPMISICGGEPLIYPHIEALIAGLLQRKRIVYVCTNAMFMRQEDARVDGVAIPDSCCVSRGEDEGAARRRVDERERRG
jgi:organic radical activating enzyme